MPAPTTDNAPVLSVAKQRKLFKEAVAARLPNVKCALTAHSHLRPGYIHARCTKASGFNRVCKVVVEQYVNGQGEIGFDVAYFGFGRRAGCEGVGSGPTLDAAIEDLKGRLTAEGQRSSKFYGALERTVVPKEQWGHNRE